MNNFFLNLLSNALNRYLKLDENSSKRLTRLQNKVITIELKPLHFIFQIVCHADGIKLYQDEPFPADTTIRGTPLQFVNIILNKKDRYKFFSDDVSIEGDGLVGELIINLFDEAAIDWEDLFSHFIGDVPAHYVSRIQKQIGDWFNRSQENFSNDVKDFIFDEKNWFPTREALNDFFQEIDTIRADVERANAKLLLLREKLLKKEEEQ